MRAQRLQFAFREDAIRWVRNHGFYYAELFGWCHPDGFAAIVEYDARRKTKPWCLAVYKSAIPRKSEVVS